MFLNARHEGAQNVIRRHGQQADAWKSVGRPEALSFPPFLVIISLTACVDIDSVLAILPG